MANEIDDTWDSITQQVQSEHTSQDGGDGAGGSGGDGTQQRNDTGNALDKLLEDHVNDTGTQTRTTNDGKSTQGEGDGTQGGKGRTTQAGGGGKQNADGDGEGTDRTQARGQVPQSPKRFGALFQSDTSGAIIDSAGRKVANPGAERRIFERIHHVYGTMEIEHATMKQKLDILEDADKAAKDAGLSIEERGASLRLMTAWKQDKVKTINFLLNQATQAGIDVSSIRAGGVDVAAIREALKEEVKQALIPFQPFVENNARDAEMRQMADAASQELSEFHEQFPNAAPHGDVIAAIMDKTGWSLRESFFALQAQAATNGWDMSKPLQPQAQATAARNNGGGDGTRRPTGGGNRELPAFGGRGGGGNGDGTVVQTGSRGPSSADASWDSIVNETLTDLGIAH